MSDTRHRPGSFCTSMLYTRDVERSRAFYERLVAGWRFDASPDDPRHLTIVSGRQAVAHVRLVDHGGDEWVPMVLVEDVDASVQNAMTLGATLVDTDTISGVARVARLRDLEGAVFGMWQPTPDGGAAVTDVVGSLWWIEVLSMDAECATQFYERLFGWQSRTTTFAPFDTYIMLEREGQQEGGVLPMDAEWGVAPRWNTIVAVRDADAACRDAEALGGCSHFVHTVASAGRIAVLGDTGGAVVVVRGPVPESPSEG